MFMDGSFCESPFMGTSTIVINGEIFYFNLIIDQTLPVNFEIIQLCNISDMTISRALDYNFIIDSIDDFDFNIDKIENNDFLR